MSERVYVACHWSAATHKSIAQGVFKTWQGAAELLYKQGATSLEKCPDGRWRQVIGTEKFRITDMPVLP